MVKGHIKPIIKKVTLICVDCKNYGRAVTALKKSMEQCSFERVLFLTDIDIEVEGVEVIKIDSISSVRQYSRFMIKELFKYFDTEYCLTVQWDGFILNGDCWEEEFLDYDFIGSAWLYQERNVGNGAFSLRSKKLQTILGTDDFIDVFHPEDDIITRTYGAYLAKKYEIKIATVEVADRFAFELRRPIQKTLGFHGYFHEEYKPVIIIGRRAAMGDVVQVEPLLYYFTKKKYMVVLDTLPQFKELFRQHFYKVHFLDEIDQRLVPGAKKYDLDFSYESKPAQLHLKTYFEFCEVPEPEMILRNPMLSLFIPIEPSAKLFKKYCVFHIPDRKQTSRNIQGDIDWAEVVRYLKTKGYDTIQLSGGEDIEGALRMNTPGEPFLMWVLRESDLMISIDSGPSNIAVAFGIPSIIFFGSVDPAHIYADLSNIEVIETEPGCGNRKCWSRVVGCEGMECIEDDPEHPSCVQYTTEQVITAINNITCK
jgi:ADP-heptose:LPS heptosyltransferase